MNLRLLFLFFAISCCASQVYAEFTLTPGVDFAVWYDDNIYLDAYNETDDVITTVSPNFLMDLKTAPLDLSLYASVSMVKYLDNTNEDRIGAGESDAATKLDLLVRLYRQILFLNVTDTYARVPIDTGGPGGVNNDAVNMTDSNTLKVNPYLQFNLMKDTQLQLGYTYQDLWYKSRYGDSAVNHIYDARLTRLLSAKTSIYLSGLYNSYRPKNADKVIIASEGGNYDYDEEVISVGLSYQPSERLLLKGEYGYSSLDYDVRDSKDSSPIWLVSADYEITSVYKIGASYTQNYAVTVDYGPAKIDILSAYIQDNSKYKAQLTLYTSVSDYVEIDREDDSYGGAVSGEVPITDKMGVAGLLKYDNYDQKGYDAEKHKRYGTELSVYYQTRLGRISSGYAYNHNNSDINYNDYTSNIIFFNGSLKF